MQRRELLFGGLSFPAALALRAPTDPVGLHLGLEALASHPEDPRAPLAEVNDEDFWAAVGRLFPVDRSLVNLNNGGVHPTCAPALGALERHQRTTQEAPAYTLWRELDPRKEGVRQSIAQMARVDAEELALTRNASEGLEALQLGFDLEPGDEVLTTDQDYPRMLETFRQRAAREGIRLVTVSIPTPTEAGSEILARFADRISDRTRLILVSHMVFLTGQVLPVREIAALGRARGIPVLVDGAHAFCHVPTPLGDLDVDFYATSLHKWLAAPQGTGLLYVRKERIPEVWPLMAAPAVRRADIRKFEEIGTHPAAPYLAIAEALDLDRAIGPRRKHGRLVHLREHWLRPVLEAGQGRAICRTPRAPEWSGAIATLSIDGIDPVALSSHLWQAHRIFTVAVAHGDRGQSGIGELGYEGLRVTPSVYTRPAELDRLVDALVRVLQRGLPG